VKTSVVVSLVVVFIIVVAVAVACSVSTKLVRTLLLPMRQVVGLNPFTNLGIKCTICEVKCVWN